eukprot:m.143633 g.143633  ORF g.143633 m.143633 type:complete len:60 (-) comp16021_c0_seq3:464-643(-)
MKNWKAVCWCSIDQPGGVSHVACGHTISACLLFVSFLIQYWTFFHAKHHHYFSCSMGNR